MTAADWVRLTLNVTAAVLSVWAATRAHRNAQQAREHATRARRNVRQAWGAAAQAELATMKIRNLTKTLRSRAAAGDRSGPDSRA